MQQIDECSAEDYLRATGRIAPGERVLIRELTGGVSNMVLAVERPERPRDGFILKQARTRLRTRHEWFSSLERNWREAEVLRVCARLLGQAASASGERAALRAHTPRILFEDRDNYLFAMTAAPAPNTTWKQLLLNGQIDPAIAAACGRLLATLHGGTWLKADIAAALGDRTLFDELRVDPYYRTLAGKRPQIARQIDSLIESLAAHPRSLVHADFSPKNLLVSPEGLMMVDFETGHYGDPAFDLGFFSSHLVLKACHKIPRHSDYLELSEVFWQTYGAEMEPVIGAEELAALCRRGVQHFAACAWARMDGKSPVEYLTDPVRRDQMRAVCRECFAAPGAVWVDVVAICRHLFTATPQFRNRTLGTSRVTKISRVVAREVLDSRGNPTVEAEVHTVGGAWGRAIVPSGASTGAAEARELRDTQCARYAGRGVLTAVAHVQQVIGPELAGYDPADQLALDRKLRELDDSPQKSRLGANAVLAVSLAAAHAGAAVQGVPLYRHLHAVFREVDPSAAEPGMPRPMINMISGGLHAGGNLDFQDFLILPIGTSDFADMLERTVRVYRQLGRLLGEGGFEGRLVGDEGGYGPRLESHDQACEMIVRAIEAAGLRPGGDVTIAIDVASTHFSHGKQYRLAATGGRDLTSEEMIDYLESLVERFPIVSLEDALAEDDWEAWQRLTARLGTKVRLVGDDLFTTNPERVRHGIELGAANSVLIKVNQIGTLTETFDTIRLARSAGYGYVVSARSGETEDTTIADLAVATAAESIKIGSITRSERLAKYNQLLRIAETL